MGIFDFRFSVFDWRGGVVDSSQVPLKHVGEKWRRGGFTLIELMVSLGILLILGAMAVAIIPSVTEGQKTIQAATQLQQWFEIAKQTAAQKRVPVGIRLRYNPAQEIDPSKKWQVVSLEFVELLSPFVLGDKRVPPFPPNTPVMAEVTGSGANVEFKDAASYFKPIGLLPSVRPVNVGDYLELAGIIYKITGIPLSDPSNPLQPQVLSISPPAPLIKTSNYRIIQRPRPMGDELLEMPKNIIIDLQPRLPANADAKWLAPPPPNPDAENVNVAWMDVSIMFGLDGRVIATPGSAMAAKEKIIFWVRDVTMLGAVGDTGPPEADPTLVVIYPATGLIATYPVDLGFFIGDYVTPLGPYTFTVTGKRSSQ